MVVPGLPALALAVTSGSKSPPGVVHAEVSKNRYIQVASPGVAAAPVPPPPGAAEVPSPQLVMSRRRSTLSGGALAGACSTYMRSSAAVTVEPGGMLFEMSNLTSARRSNASFVRPEKRPGLCPFESAGDSANMLLSCRGASVTVSARAARATSERAAPRVKRGQSFFMRFRFLSASRAWANQRRHDLTTQAPCRPP